MINSELKAVIQELKMYKDDHGRSLTDDLVARVFKGHPYSHPILGYKQDLWSLSRENLHNFYKKHYVPNNATLVVVGDIDPEDVVIEAEKTLGKIPADPNFKKEKYYFNPDISSTHITHYRDIQEPIEMLGFIVPGAGEKQEYVIDALNLILGSGYGSRLYKKLVNELDLVNDIGMSYDGLVDHGMSFIVYHPKKIEDVDKINSIIFEEIDSIIKKGLSEKELNRAVKKTLKSFLSTMEDNMNMAFAIGYNYIATQDDNYIFDYINHDNSNLEQEIKDLLSKYFRPSVAHRGEVLPLPESEKKHWLEMQEKSDKEDFEFLSKKVRTSPVEEPSYVNKVQPGEHNEFSFPKAQELDLKNGIKSFLL